MGAELPHPDLGSRKAGKCGAIVTGLGERSSFGLEPRTEMDRGADLRWSTRRGGSHEGHFVRDRSPAPTAEGLYLDGPLDGPRSRQVPHAAGQPAGAVEMVEEEKECEG